MKLSTLLFSISVLFFSCQFTVEAPEVSDQVQTEVPIEEEQGTTFTSAEEMKKAIESGDVQYDFYANFTEPFFTIYIIGRQALIVRMDEEDEMYELLIAFNPAAVKQEIIIGETPIIILKEKGSDGMSGLIYPYTAEYGEFVGGGATERIKEE